MLKAPLFISYKERVSVFLILLAVAFFSLGQQFLLYQKFIDKKRYFTTATVLAQYEKNRKIVLKLQTKEGFTFYTSTKEELKDLRDREIKVLLFRPKKVPSFLEFLRHFYYPSYIVSVLPKNRRLILKEYITKQHQKSFFKELFGALFLATALSKQSRDYLANFGISHLVAISGFHLGLISGVVTFLLALMLRPLWQRFVPYLNLYFFASLVAIGVAAWYMSFVGFLPSLVRSFVMMVIGFLLFIWGIEILSFELLFWIGIAIIAFFPRFLFSYAFWLSMSGVFMIYLFLHHFKKLRWWQIVVFLNFWVFWLMLPIGMAIFEKFSFYQFFSPFLSILFTIFYPLEGLLHLFGIGGVLDSSLSFLAQKPHFIKAVVPWWFIAAYIGLLFGSIYRRALLWALLGSVAGILIYNIA